MNDDQPLLRGRGPSGRQDTSSKFLQLLIYIVMDDEKRTHAIVNL